MKVFIFFLLASIHVTLFSQEFEINKIDEIAYSQGLNSAESVQVIDNYLFSLNLNGLEIYEIDILGNLTKLSNVTIETPFNMIIDNNFCFIIGRGYESPYYIPNNYKIIYKIDISDVNNPIIVNQLEYPDQNEYIRIIKFEGYLAVEWLVYNSGAPTDIYYDIYDISNLEFIGQVLTYNFHRPFNDSLLVSQDGYIISTVQYNPPDEFEIIGVTDVSSYSDGNYVYDHYKVTNDTILSAVNYKNITFWDISDETNWQYISRYTLPGETAMIDTKQYSIANENIVIFTSSPNSINLLDISNIYDPVLVDSLDNLIMGFGCDNFGNELFVGTVHDGIKNFKINNNTIEYNDSFYDHIRFYVGEKVNEKLVISTVLEGYYLLDIENPFNLNDLGLWFEDYRYELIHKQGNWMLLKDFNEYRFVINDIMSLDNPTQRNTIFFDDPFEYSWSYCIIDEFDPNSIYTFNILTKVLTKFDITESGEAIEMFEFNLPGSSFNLTVINSVCYVTLGPTPFDLLIIDGLDENEPNVANEINSFSENGFLECQDGYLIADCYNNGYEIVQVFQLGYPLHPELYFTPQWGGSVTIHDEFIFSRLDQIIGVYENRPGSSDLIEVFNGLNYVYNIELLEYEGVNYLVTIEMGNIGLFEYIYTPSSSEDELLKPEISLSNYPNPFNPETTITFNLTTEITENPELVIYNLKGQKVDQLEIKSCESGVNEVIWDAGGFASGVYLYQLKVDGKTIASRKCLLLK